MKKIPKSESIVATDPRFEEYMRLLSAMFDNLEAYDKFTAYLDNEPTFTRLLREALLDEETYIWYAELGCETKGYQWYQSAQDKYVQLLIYTLETLVGDD